jgi:hypothetical protein
MSRETAEKNQQAATAIPVRKGEERKQTRWTDAATSCDFFVDELPHPIDCPQAGFCRRRIQYLLVTQFRTDTPEVGGNHVALWISMDFAGCFFF